MLQSPRVSYGSYQKSPIQCKNQLEKIQSDQIISKINQNGIEKHKNSSTFNFGYKKPVKSMNSSKKTVQLIKYAPKACVK